MGGAPDVGADELFLASPSLLGPATDTTRPVISRLSLSHRRFRVGGRRGRGLAPRGTTFRFRLSERVTVTFSIARRTTGRRVGGRCRPTTRRNRSRRRCGRYVRVGGFRRSGAAGSNRVPFSGKLRIGGHRKALGPGRYRATLGAKDAAGNSATRRRVGFRVVRRR